MTRPCRGLAAPEQRGGIASGGTTYLEAPKGGPPSTGSAPSRSPEGARHSSPG